MRLFLLAPRPKSRRHHINKGWAWFEAKLQPIFTIDSQRVGQLEDHGRSHWTALPNYLFAWQKFPCKSFKQWEWPNPRFTKFFSTWRAEGSQKNNLQADGLQWSSPRGRGSTLWTRQWTMIKSAWQKLPRNWEFARFKFGEFLNEKGWSITKENNMTKADSWDSRGPDSTTVEALQEAHDPDARRASNQCPGSNGWWVIFKKHMFFWKIF